MSATTNRYVMVEATESGDLYATPFYYYDDALKAVEESERKCVIVKIEGVCFDQPGSIDVEYHT